jgi:hypothetical protein
MDDCMITSDKPNASFKLRQAMHGFNQVMSLDTTQYFAQTIIPIPGEDRCHVKEMN